MNIYKYINIHIYVCVYIYIYIYTLVYIKWITNKDLPNSTWNSTQYSIDLYGNRI